MSKRPHAAIEDGPKKYSDDGIRLRKRTRRAEAVLDHGRKQLFRALKLSKGFERQKLGRRQKLVQAKDESVEIVSRLEDEVEALKQLDLSATAEQHFYKSLIKIPVIRSSPALPLYVKSRLNTKSHINDRTAENVRARLLNSNAVKTALEQILAALCDALQLPREVARKKNRFRSVDYDTVHDGDECSRLERDADGQSDLASQSSWSGLSSDCTTAACDSGVNDDVRVSAYGTENLHAREDRVRRVLNARTGDAESESVDSDNTRRLLRSSTSSQSSASSSLVRGSQVPFLANGYFSGSSDAESISFEDTKPRKNRRGQQERRAIWEKKFGKNANHFKRQERSRDHGWDAKKGSRGSSRETTYPSHKPRYRKSPAQTQMGDTNQDSKANPRGRQDSRQAVLGSPLHPSWEAAKRAKGKGGTQILPFQGKKLVFD